MDVLRKELNSIYAAQHLEEERLSPAIVQECRLAAATCAAVDNDCRVVTDASADTCYIFGGELARVLGLHDETGAYACAAASSDEDEIYNRMHPEDLVEKRMLEYEFFKLVHALPPDEKTMFKATCSIRIRNRRGDYVRVDNSTRVMRTSPAGKIWLILCCYDTARDDAPRTGISAAVTDMRTGVRTPLSLAEKRARILTAREKEILMLIADGLPSKQIADRLSISVHTVNRHRQNILAKLSVGNSVEALKAVAEMKLM